MDEKIDYERIRRMAAWLEGWASTPDEENTRLAILPKVPIYSEKDPEVRAQRYAELAEVRENYKAHCDNHVRIMFREWAKVLDQVADFVEQSAIISKQTPEIEV